MRQTLRTVIICAFALLVSRAGRSEEAFHWTLADVKKIALEKNPDIRTARATFEASQKIVGETISAYLPHVTLNASFSQTTLPEPSAGSTDLLGTAEPYTFVTASVKQLLFDFGKTLSRIDSSSALSRSSEQNAVAIRNAIELAVERTFYNVAASDKLVAVAQKGLEQFSETHRRASILVKTGTRPLFDLSQAAVELSKAKLALIKAQNARDIARVELLNLLGMQRQVSFDLVDQPEDMSIASSKLDLQALTDTAFTSRPEMKSSEYAADSAKYDLQAGIRDFSPTIGFQAWYGRYLPNFPPALNQAWGVGVGATWEIFSGMGTTFRASELSARLDQRQALVDKERADVAADVAASYMDLVRAESNRQVAQETFDFAKENFGYAKARYNASIATILELLVAETSLVNAEASVVEARYERATAVAALEKAVNAPLLPLEHP